MTANLSQIPRNGDLCGALLAGEDCTSMASICRHDSAVPWIFMPFDVKSDYDTKYGELLWCHQCDAGLVKDMPDENVVATHYSIPKYYTQGNSHMPEVTPNLLDRLLIKLAWTFDEGTRNLQQVLREYVTPPGVALDIGSGHGDLLQQLGELGFEATGVEPDPEARNYSLAKGIGVLNGTAERLPPELDGQKFDLVMMTHVLEHCRKPELVLQNVRNLLAEDGIFYCEVPNCGSIYFQEFSQISEMLDVPRHLHFFTKSSLQRLCDSIRFVVVGWNYHGFTRHYHPSWRAWENSTHRRLKARGVTPSVPPRSLANSVRLLGRTIGARHELKYDSIGFFARKL